MNNAPLSGASTLKNDIYEICESFEADAIRITSSEFKTASFASFMMPLGQIDLGKKAILDCLKRSYQPY